jgi:hypothetical protein
MPASGPSEVQKWIAVLASLGSVPLVWWWLSRSLRKKGWGAWGAHITSALASSLGLLPVAILIADPGAFSVIFFVLVFGPIVWLARPVRLRQVAPLQIDMTPTVAPVPAPIIPVAPLSVVEIVPITSPTTQTVVPVVKVKREPIEDPLARWKASAPTTGSGLLTEIEFDYENANGNRSHRTVSVNAVDDEHFEGFCYKALETRTFVIGRVRGKVTVCDTGELLQAKVWAAEARRDPRNGVVTMDGPDRRDDQALEAESSNAIEILFTGFPKAQRADLEQLAEDYGMTVRKSVTQGLDYLCAGATAGPAKLSQAMDAGVTIIDSDDFLNLLK